MEGSGAMAGAAQADLVDRLGRDRVLLGEAARRHCGFDPAGREGPIAVALPAHAEHVEHIVRIGRQRHVPVEVRGRMAGAHADLLRDAVVVDTRGLGRPPAIDISRRIVTVGAGVDVSAIDRAARPARLCLRGLPSLLSGDTLGGLLAAGEPGELGLGEGSLLADVVGAQVVTGGGRTLQVGSSDLIGQPPWLGEGLPNPLAILFAAEGRMAVLCEVTLRLHRAPHIAWSTAHAEPGRPLLLAALSAARAALSARLVDSVLIAEGSGRLHIHVRAVTWRGDDDLPAVTSRVKADFAHHGIHLGAFRSEEPRARLGQQAGEFPRASGVQGPTLELRVSWPDVAAVLDVADALGAELTDPPVRQWAVGSDYLRLACSLEGARPDQHPLVLRGHHLLDAGAVPIASGQRLRAATRERMPPAAKVLLAALARAWDPEGVLSPRMGVL